MKDISEMISEVNDGVEKLKDALKAKRILYCESATVEPFFTNGKKESVLNAFDKAKDVATTERAEKIQNILCSDDKIWIMWDNQIEKEVKKIVKYYASDWLADFTN